MRLYNILQNNFNNGIVIHYYATIDLCCGTAYFSLPVIKIHFSYIIQLHVLFSKVAVTKQHEDELFSSSIYASMEPYDPVMSFEDYIADDEDIVDQVCMANMRYGRCLN